MALIDCPECGTQVSNKAVACVKCGYPIRSNSHSTSPQNEPVSAKQGEHACLHCGGRDLSEWTTVLVYGGVKQHVGIVGIQPEEPKGLSRMFANKREGWGFCISRFCWTCGNVQTKLNNLDQMREWYKR